MNRWKWLYPGMRVKRWIALVVLGVILIALGTTVLFDTHLLAILERKMTLVLRWVLPGRDWLAGIMAIILGFILLGWGMRSTIRSLLAVVQPAELDDLADTVYRKRSLDKGPRIVVIGGGTGLSTLLRGLKDYSNNLTAIVTVADDGGSSGRIREELGILPPGDIRNTVVALAEAEPLMQRLFQYRFSWGRGLSGHSFGNLFVAAMTDITGDFELAIKELSRVLLVRGKVLPSTLMTVKLKAKYTDGSEVVGESLIPSPGKKIERVYLLPDNVQAVPEAIEAIHQADVIVLGPGSLYTSVIPNLLVSSISEEIAHSDACKVYVCNVMTQPGETQGMSAADHVRAIFEHSRQQRVIEFVLVNESPISAEQAAKYESEGAFPVEQSRRELEMMGLEVISAPLLDHSNLVRHDSQKLAAAIMDIAANQRIKRQRF